MPDCIKPLTILFGGEIEFLEEFFPMAGMINWTLRSILSTSLKTVG